MHERLLKNDEHLYFGSTDTKVVVEWFDTVDGVLWHMGCPPEHWARVATGAI